MSNERLLKRVKQWSMRQVPASDHGVYVESVLADLSMLYNTQHGTALIDNTYGLPDFTNIFNNLTPPDIDMMQRAIMDTTNRFETRLKSVTVNYEDRKNEFGLLRFSVTSQLMFLDGLFPLNYSVLLNGDGSVAIEVK
ncbi:MAG: type VI secretion system baseplate subunit TssE [Ectothiorhodospiraceae bacterium]|nr:type VI secretion system baseplate subunit TssE [Ectothiorhodospiraceae bacterium]